jgi:hypothetical protein
MYSTFLFLIFSRLLHVGGGQGTLPVLVKNVMSAYHNILEPVLGWLSKKESKTRILVEPLEPRLHVSLKCKKHTCGSGGVSIIT